MFSRCFPWRKEPLPSPKAGCVRACAVCVRVQCVCSVYMCMSVCVP